MKLSRFKAVKTHLVKTTPCQIAVQKLLLQEKVQRKLVLNLIRRKALEDVDSTDNSDCSGVGSTTSSSSSSSSAGENSSSNDSE